MMKSTLYLNFTALIMLIISGISCSLGAEVSIGKETFGDPVINISGKIEKGDLAKVKNISAELISSLGEYSNTPLKFYLNTPGGDIEEAIKIGRFAHDILAEVDCYGKIIVAPDSEMAKLLIEGKVKDPDYIILSPDSPINEQHIVRNYSAGILIFYGAVKRNLRDNSDQRLAVFQQQKIPVMGIHRPHYDAKYYSALSPTKAAQAYQYLEKETRAYLIEMGAPQEIIDRMFNTASNQIDLIPSDEFGKYYKSEESFLQEWLLAKCGNIGTENILTSDEKRDFDEIGWEQTQLQAADKDSSNKPVRYIYPSTKYSQKYVVDLYSRVRRHSFSYESCHLKAISSHQKEWAKQYSKSRNN